MRRTTVLDQPLAVAADEPLLGIDTVVGGLRVVRRLGAGERAEVYLAVVDSEPPMALKAYRRWVSDDDIAREIEAMTCVSNEHVVQLLDVASDRDGRPCLVLERHPKGSLSELFTSGRPWSAGEAVTVLAPLAQTLGVLHTAGVAHGALGPGRVLFSERGAPVLIGWGRAALFAAGSPPVALEQHETATRDRMRLRRIAGSVLEAVTGDTIAMNSCTALAGWLDSSADTAGFCDELAERLFAVADPQPIDLGRGGVAVPVTRPAFERVAVPPRIDDADSRQEPASRPGWLAALPLPEWLHDAAAAHGATWSRQILTRLRTVRLRFWFAAAAVAVAFTAAMVLIPGNDSAPDAGTGHDPQPTGPATAGPPIVGEGSAVLADDPLAAAAELLQTRARCLRDLSVLCLDAVAQPGSAALTADEATIRAVRDGQLEAAAVDVAVGDPLLVERLGNSALIDLGTDSEPASLLVIRSEAGWRIRAYLGDQ
ncbi:protein kinase [Salinibacterium sp. ZJ450]|uniref:protein kinase domain-containing protein n=1 Tax=Salinibacterium sp. ZJ450 TaxID=2708338 RepID=UPI00141DBC01|nr:protein kinase [Salinibacterium sp. ZJ450]